MNDTTPNPEAWRELAAKASTEQDPAKLREVVNELLKALSNHENRKKPSRSTKPAA